MYANYVSILYIWCIDKSKFWQRKIGSWRGMKDVRKNRDKRQRWRCHTVAVQLSLEESKLLDIAVKLSVVINTKLFPN